VRLGVGETSREVLIRVVTASRVSGKIVTPAGPCESGDVTLSDKPHARSVMRGTTAGGVVEFPAVLPGVYAVEVGCAGFHGAKTYPPVDAIHDATGLEWNVEAGRSIHGKVVDETGAPVGAVMIDVDGPTRTMDRSGDDDGAFKLDGLEPGTYALQANLGILSHAGDPVTADVSAHDAVDVKLVVPRSGSIDGTVVDDEGAPQAGVEVVGRGDGFLQGGPTGDDGSFLVTNVAPGKWELGAMQQKQPLDSPDDAKNEVTVAPGATASIKIVVERAKGVIAGGVVDETGKPIDDAYVDLARESDGGDAKQEMAVSFMRAPILTDVGGKFRVDKLPDGKYTVKAFRKGGGEAFVEHVAPNGPDVTVTVRATGAIEGQVVPQPGAAAPETFHVAILDDKTKYEANEDFTLTGGRFTMNDLPAGDYQVSVSSIDGDGLAESVLAAGQHADLTVKLERKSGVHGRFVELDGGAPIGGLLASAYSTSSPSFSIDSSTPESAADGTFTIPNAPSGDATISVMPGPRSFADSPYDFVRIPRQVTAGADNDLGDLKIPRRRVKLGGDAGVLGIKPQGDSTVIDSVVPDGAAAAAGIVAGDVVTSVDGYDVAGPQAYLFGTLVTVPKGTTVALGLARGVVVKVTAR
jgi:hypothetical protein